MAGWQLAIRTDMTDHPAGKSRACILTLVVVAACATVYTLATEPSALWTVLAVVPLLAAVLAWNGYRRLTCLLTGEEGLELHTAYGRIAVHWSDLERVRTILGTTTIKIRGRRLSFFFEAHQCGKRRWRELTDILYAKTNTPRL